MPRIPIFRLGGSPDRAAPPRFDGATRLLAAETSQSAPGPSWLRSQAGTARRPKNEPADWKSMLTELHVAALNRAKKEEKIAIDLLARLAVTKFLRMEMNQQFGQVLERCR